MLRLGAGSLAYVAVGLTAMWVFEQWLPLETSLLVAGTVIGLLVVVPLLTVVWRYLATFGIDRNGIYQQNALQWYQNQIGQFDDVGALSWSSDLTVIPYLPWMIVLIWPRKSGGALSRLRGLFRPKRSYFLPRRWLIADIDRVETALKEYAPVGHPLRKLYGLADPDAAGPTSNPPE